MSVWMWRRYDTVEGKVGLIFSGLCPGQFLAHAAVGRE